ncbi:MAG TPA: MHYT domain-containing protein [Gemmatimonadaceae bacterium]|jgi:PAS domain S-box-containing protein
MNHATMLHAMFDPIEVVASIVIAIVASYAALALSARVGSRTRMVARAPWLIGGGLAVGLGIAGMHFVGMLAMRLDAPVSYDIPLTILSFAVAVAAATAALAAATSRAARIRPMMLASTVFGIAVAGMHYIGMSAMRGPFDVSYNSVRVALSIVIAIVASAAAFWLAHRLRGVAGTRGFIYQLGSATVMGLAIAAMHYTGISAVTFTPRPLKPGIDGGIVGHDLSTLVAIVGLVVLGAAILIAMLDQRARQVAREVALSNARYREMADAMPQIVWTTVGDGNVDYFNKRWFDYTGKTPGAHELNQWANALHPDDVAHSLAQWTNAVVTGERYEVEYRLRRHDGEYQWHLGRGIPLRDSHGTVIKWFGTLTNIHEQKLAQALLRAHQATLESQIVESEAEAERARELYALLAENATDMVSTHRQDGSFDYATPSWIEYLGESPTGKLPVAWSHLDDRKQLVENHVAGFTSKTPITTVWRCRRFDGSFGWLETRTRTVRNAHGEVITFVCATRDVTQAKRDELAMRESEDKYRQLVEQAADAILLGDADGRFIAANHRAELLAGAESGVLIGREVTSFLVPSSNKSARLSRPRTVNGVTTAEYDVHRDDGNVVPIEASITTLSDGRVQIIARDISGRRELERLKDEFVSIVSHELRTPLTSIRGALGLLESGKLAAAPEKAGRMLTVAVANTDRLIRLINDILDVERIDSGSVAMDFAWCNARDIATQVIEALHPVAEQAGVQLAMQDGDARIWADADRLTQTLTNLVSNAIKFSPRDSAVSVGFALKNTGVEFEVRDSGRGIPAEKLESIFERFQQVDASDAREKGGTGLGLAICRSIIAQHGGRIWAEQNEGGGSAFKFMLPRRASGVSETTVASTDVAEGKAASRVLVIEDDIALAQVTALALESRGLSVATAHSGADALEWITRSSPDILIVDLGLPDMGGLEVIAKIRHHTAGLNVRTIVYTAADPGIAARERIKALGAELATKSRVTVEALVDRVVDLSGRAEMEAEPLRQSA